MKAPSILAFALVATLASPAAALPLYFNGPGNFGTQAVDADFSVASDPGLDFLDLNATGYSLSLAGGAGLPNPSCADAPGDSSCLDLTVVLPPTVDVDLSSSPSLSDPTRATSVWQVTNTSGFPLEAAYLVFVSSVGALTGDPLLVGIEPMGSDDYTVITFDAGSFGQIYYAAIGLGTMNIGETTEVSVHYAIADQLIPAGGMDFLLPILNTQAIVVPVPEPGTFSLFALGLLGLAAQRRRTCA